MTGYIDALIMGFDCSSAIDADGLDTPKQGAPSPPAATEASGQRVHPSNNVTIYQTTGPDAHTSPTTDASGAPTLNPRSCVTCRRRKVRCDKLMPCSNCRRASIPCVFPAPGRAPRQPRPKDPNAPTKNSSQRELELMKRLRKLEGIVEELSGQIEVESAGKGPSSASSPEAPQGISGIDRTTSNAPARQSSLSGVFGHASESPKGSESAVSEPDPARRQELHKKFGRLVLDGQGSKGRYVSSGFWTKLNDELDSIRKETQRLTDEEDSEYDDEQTPVTAPTAAALDHHGFIFGYRSADVNLQKCHPIPSHVPYLWSVYQENVESLLKVVHVPSMDAVFRDARKYTSKLTPGQESLVFAIYYAAIISLEPDEVETNLGVDRDELLIQYRFAVEQALSKANFLNTTDIAVLQAFVIFLTVVRRQDYSRFCWSLCGLLIHLGQGMGLHRDGTHFGLSPFETEMRRRVWWQMILLDLRASDELGTDLLIQDSDYDTRMPMNINDLDISPEDTEFPEPREGRSDTAVAIVRFEMCNASRRFIRESASCPKGDTVDKASLCDRESMLIEIYHHVESSFLKNVVDATDPLYCMAAMIARVIMAKMCLVIYQPLLFPGTDVELGEDARQRVYVAAIEIIEYNFILNSDPRCKQYRWLFQTYANWHAIAYVLIESCRRPWTALVERGWQALNGFMSSPIQYTKTPNHASLVLPLKKLTLRATKHRAAELVRLRNNPDEARRLDFMERMDPAQARFGSVPGAEAKMEQIREQWRLMVCPATLRPPTTIMPGSGHVLTNTGTSPDPRGPQMQVIQPVVPGSSATPQLDMGDVALNVLDDIMNTGSVFQHTALWPIAGNELALKQSRFFTGPTTANDTPATPQQAPNQQLQQASADQQFQAQAGGMPEEEYPPPYFWDMGTGAPIGDLGGEDIDMLGDGFNWQDWSQSIKGLEMESAQGQTNW